MSDDIINILNLNLDIVQSYSSTISQNQLFYRITFVRKNFLCPLCFHKLLFKDYRPLKIKHEIIRGKETTIIFNRRRFFCPFCHSFHYESNPFSSKTSPRFSDYSSMLIMAALKEHSATFSMVARCFNTSPTKIISIFDSFGQMHKKSFPKAISIDEFYWNRKSNSKYACVILDFISGDIIDIIHGRKKSDWHSYLQLIDPLELKRVKYISIDMFDAYRQIQKIFFSSAVLSVDPFHVIKNINLILKKERIKVMNAFHKDSIEYYLLKNFNWLLMMDSAKIKENKSKYNKKLHRYINYPQLLELILNISPTLKEAYELKEDYLFFNQFSSIAHARENLADIISHFSKSSIRAYCDFSSTLIDWFDEIVNSFLMIDGKRLTNGKIESINARIKVILKNANGYRNFSRMRNRIMYSLNKDALPTTHEMSEVIKKRGTLRGSYRKKIN